MNITYKNKHGTIRMNGGGNDNAWRIYEISGIGFPKKAFTYNTYAGVIGQELNSVSIPSRTITISGDISERSQAALSMAYVMRILNEDGDLTIQTGRKVRRAKVRTLSFDVDQRKAMYKKFVLQIESDNPFFFGRTAPQYSIFNRTMLLSSPFMLPQMFSRRDMGADVINSGDTATEPTIVITKPANSEIVTGDKVVLANTSTEAIITLNHTMQPGEIVTISIPDRTITSNISGNILTDISIGTVLSSFILQTGNNNITCGSSDTTLSVICKFEELYLEAAHDE